MSENEIKAAPSEREFTVAEGISYLIGAIGIQLTTTMVATWAVIFYCPPLGQGKTIFVTLGLATAMMITGQIINAVSCPLVGYWSDNTRSKLGRRRPFIIFGSIPMVVSFILFWLPPVQGNNSMNMIWGITCISIYFFMLSIVMVPYISLMPEMAKTTQGRVRIGVYNAVGMILGLILGVMSSILIESMGYKTTAIILGAFTLLCFQITGWTVKERYKESASPTGASLKELFAQLASTLKNYPFLIFVISVTVFNLGFYVIQIALPDFNFVILDKKEDFVAMLFIPFLLVCLPLTFFVESFVSRLNKKVVYAAGIFGFAILFPFMGLIGMIHNETVRLVCMLVLIGLAGAPQAINYVMPGAMIGEIADYDEKTSGQRREALYSGAMTFGVTMAMGMGYLVRWAVYSPFGTFSKSNHLPVLLIGPVTGVISLIGFFIFLKYPVLHVVAGEEKKEG